MGIRVYFLLFDGGMAALFLFMGYRFYKSQGRASRYIAGYNTKTEKERQLYDEAALCRCYGRRIMLWSTCFVVGFIIDSIILGVGIWVETLLFVVALLYHIFDMHKHAEARFKKQDV